MNRRMCLALCASVLASSSGCRALWTDEVDRAKDYHALVKVGMTQEEVRAIAGEADEIEARGARHVWTYRYSCGSGVYYWICQLTLMLLLLPLTIIALIVGKSRHHWFAVGFGAEGRVDGITPVMRHPEPKQK